MARHIEAAFKEATGRNIADVVARCLLPEAIRCSKRGRSNYGIVAELMAAADNLDDPAGVHAGMKLGSRSFGAAIAQGQVSGSS